MEIRLQGTAMACVAQQAIVAGRAVKLEAAVGKTSPDVTVGANYPTSANDTAAHYVAAFRVYNEVPPIYEGLPTLDEDGNSTSVVYTLRQFVEGSENLPADVKLRMVAPRLKDTMAGETILSGALMLAYDDGIYTVTSGCFDAGSYVVGDALSVQTTGRFYESSTGQVGTVMEYDSSTAKLTIKTKSTV